MSNQALTLVTERQFGSSSKKLVMLILANYADEAWSCFPGQEKIAAEGEMTDRTVRTVLKELEEDGLIRRQERRRDDGYKTSDRTYLVREAIKSLPEIISYENRSHRKLATTSQEIDDTSHRKQFPGIHQETHQLDTSDSQLTLDGGGDLPTTHSVASVEANVSFDEFWKIYPRRAGKGQAAKAWKAAIKKASAHMIIEAAAAFRDDPNLPDQQFIPHPATWLNGERWEDGPLPDRRQSANVSRADDIVPNFWKTAMGAR